MPISSQPNDDVCTKIKTCSQTFKYGGPELSHQNQMLTANSNRPQQIQIAHSKLRSLTANSRVCLFVEGRGSLFYKGETWLLSYLDVYNVYNLRRIAIHLRIEYPCLRHGRSRNEERLTFFYMNVLISCLYAFLSRAVRYSYTCKKRCSCPWWDTFPLANTFPFLIMMRE